VTTGSPDRPRVHEPSGIGKQHDLEQQARAIRGRANLIVAKARVELAEIKFVIDR